MRHWNLSICSEASEPLAEIELLFPGSGIEQIELLFTGHSHMHAVVRSLRSKAPDSEQFVSDHRVAVLLPTPNSDYRRALAVVAPAKTIIISWQGNQHSEFLFSALGSFDFVYSKKPDLPLHAPWDLRAAPVAARMRRLKALLAGGLEPSPQGPLIPEQLVREHFSASLVELRRLLADLTAAGARRIIILGGPAPRGNDEEVLERVTGERLLNSKLEEFRRGVGSVRVTPLLVRMKLWAVIQDLLQETAAAAAAEFLAAPQESFDWENGLNREYWAGDVTHANQQYGDLIVRRLGQYL